MTTFPRAESRRLYSWWWDSHISPKNSKWLQENLTDMDMKVKAMIKLIEEDADSFARRAEMYYKKRPELMKLVEEFYRAYRALAERYDHATGALRHAHRTMSVAFSDHIPLALPDESLSNSTPETPSPRHGMFDADDPQNDAFGMPTPFNAFDRTAPPEETETLPAKRGLNHFNGMLKKRDGVARVKLPEGNDLKGLDVNEEEVTARVRLPEVKVRKSLNFEEEEETGPTAKVYIDSKSHLQPELKQKEDVRYGVKHIQEQVSQLSSENQKLKVQIELESKHLDLSRAEIQNLRDEVSKLETEKDAALLQKQLCHENISTLEIEISRLKNEIRKLNEEMEMAGLKLSGAEQQCLALEKANQSLQLELEEAKIELEELRHSLNSSGQKLKEAEMAVESKEQLCNQSSEKFMLMTSEIETLVEKLTEVERSKGALEEEVSQLKGMNNTLNEHNLACALRMKHLEDEIISLKEIKDKLENEIENRAESNQVLQREVELLKDEKNEMDLNHQSLRKEMEAASLHIDSLEAQVKDYQYGHAKLKERCSKLEDEKLLFLNKLKDLESVSERNSVMENSLSDANVELEELREKIVALKGSCESLHAAVSSHAGEKTALSFQIETLAGKVEKLSDKNTLLENSLDDANTELEGLRSKLRDLEESFQSLSHANSDLVAQRNNLISQVESFQQSLANLEATHATLEDKHSTLVKEKDLSVNKILKLEDSLSVMQKDYDSLIRSKDISLAAIENQLLLLQEDGQLREEELEEEQQRCFSHTTQIFVLQRCLHEMSNSLIIEKEKYQSLIKSSEIQLAASESQIHLLQEERKAIESKIEEEEQKSINSMLEIFILQRCLSEMKGDNLTLLQECHKHLEASRCADELIKQLEDRELAQKENITLLMEQDQIFRMEIMVYLNILKQTWLEKALLSTELEKINKQSLVLQREHLQLFEEHEQLCHGASATDFMSITLKAGLVSLTGKLINLSEKVHNLIEEKNALEEENSLLFVEASIMENLYLFFRCLNSENVGSLLAVKNGLDEEIRGSKAIVRAVENENKQLKESLVFFEELRSRITISEFDFHFARSFCEELMLQVEAGENLLAQKCGKLEVSNKELDESKIMRSELEKRVAVLLEGASCKDNQIACVTGENRTLKEELNRYKVEVETLKMRQQLLSCELREEKDEVDRCEGEIMELFGEAQASVVNATVLDEKMFELASRCAGLDISALVLLETMKEEIIVRNNHTFDLKKKLDDFENENGELRTNLKALSPLIFALGNGISNVEKQISRLEKLDGYQENSSFPHQEDHKTSTGNHGHSTILGVSEMQNLIAKVEALQNLLVGAMDHLDQDRLQSAAQLQSARREIEELKLKQSSIREEGQGKETSYMVKDIELDQVSSSFGVRMIQGAESDDQMLNSWGAAAAADSSNRASVDHGIEAVQEVTTEKPSSELATEKAFGVYKMEISREIKESQEEWNRRVIKRLAYDAEKLSALRAGADELKLMMEKSGPSTRQNRLQFGALQAKLKDAEEAIFDLIDRNGKLTMMVEAYSDPYDGGEEMGRAERGRVVEQARRASDRIGTLELELQKIDYIFLKLQEEWEGSPSGGADRSPRVLLRDYIYGRKDKHGKKRGYFCGCMRPRTQDGY